MADASDWAGGMGRTWARLAEATDRQLAGVTAPLAAALAPRAGERILDLGCGSGNTTLALAEAVAPGGAVVGLDISSDQIAVAEKRATDRRATAASFIVADAASFAFAPQSFDALHSRHGGMFFDDPAAAFANIRAGLKPGARIVMSAFAPLADNPWATVPLAAAEPHLPPEDPTPPGAPGPFAWADPEASVGPALKAAGFSEIGWEGMDVPFVIGMAGSESPVERAIAHVCEIGMLARRLKALEEPDRVRPAVEAALFDAFAPHVSDGWVRLAARVWLVRASA